MIKIKWYTILHVCMYTTQDSNQMELQQLEESIATKQRALDTILPQYQEYKGREERLTVRLKACEQHRSELFAKQGRVQQFSSVRERDRWINNEMTSLQQSAAQKERQVLGMCTCITM